MQQVLIGYLFYIQQCVHVKPKEEIFVSVSSAHLVRVYPAPSEPSEAAC